MLPSPDEITFESATIVNAVADASAISLNEIYFLPQKAAACVSFSEATPVASTSSTCG